MQIDSIHSNASRSEIGFAECQLTECCPGGNVRYYLPAQPIDATHALNLSAGVSNCKVSRGRSLSWRATLFR